MKRTPVTTIPAGEPRKAPSKAKAFFSLVITAVFGSLIASFLVLPYTLFAAGTAQASIEWWEELPHDLEDVNIPQRTIITDRNGKRIGQVFSQDRVIVPLDKISKHMVNALIATEDSRFYEHRGLDAKGVSRAIVNNTFGGYQQGASTLTQQLVENLRVLNADNEEELKAARATSSGSDKLQELRFATALEAEETKDEILSTYLNVVYFGNNAYGAEAAAQRYFSKHAAELTVDEAATLVGMLKSPTYYDPIANPENSRLRRDVVMKRMVEVGDLPEAKYYQLIKKPTKLKPKKPKQGCAKSPYPFYCQLTLNYFLEQKEFGETREERAKNLASGGYEIRTAMDAKAMDAAQRAVDRALGRDNRIAAGVALVQPGTGHVLAVAQNRDYGTKKGRTEYVYADTPQFQPGSTFKAITAAAALEEGFSRKTRLNSPSPAFYDNLDEPPGGFKNDNRQGRGYIDMRTALKFSVNTYFTNLTSQVGVKDVAAMARRLGMKSMPSDLSGREGAITLGAYETSPLELATVYATLAGRGVMCKPVVIVSMKKRETGEKVRVPNGDCHQEISPAVADTVSDLLLAPFEEGGTASKLKLAGGRKATGKTGTTNSNAATWFAGYTPQAATAVWIGDPRGGSRYPVSNVWAYGSFYGTVWGGTIAGPIWRDIMNDFHKGKEKRWYPKPGGVSASMTSRVIPDVRSIDVNSAITILLEAGFQVKIAKKTAKPNKNLLTKNIVVDQSPKAGGKAAFEDVITLKLSNGSDVKVKVPSTVEALQQETEMRQQAKGAKK